MKRPLLRGLGPAMLFAFVVASSLAHASKGPRREGLGVQLEPDEDEAALLLALRDDESGSDLLRPSVQDESRGPLPHRGWLHGGVQLSPDRGYVIRDVARAWGTSSAVSWLREAFDAVLLRDPRAPRVRVHDSSLPGGGPMDGHKSHQSGRDVDLSYYQRSVTGVCPAVPVTSATLDAPRQWRLLSYWLQRGEAEFVFVDYALQKPLYEAAQAAGATSAELARYFQYPRRRDVPAGIIRHEDKHANHVHVRFRCGEGEKACQRTPTRELRPTADGSEEPLLELLEDESERELFELIR